MATVQRHWGPRPCLRTLPTVVNPTWARAFDDHGVMKPLVLDPVGRGRPAGCFRRVKREPYVAVVARVDLDLLLSIRIPTPAVTSTETLRFPTSTKLTKP